MIKSYDSYKESGVEWIGMIPSHWILSSIKSFSDTNSTVIGVDEFKDKEVIHYSIPNIQEFGIGQIENGSDIDSSKILLKGNEVLISKLNPRKSCVTIVQSSDKMIIGSGEFLSFKPIDLSSKLLYYQFKNYMFTDFLDSCVESVTRSHQRVRPEILYTSKLPVPPLPEQLQIVKYLDEKTTFIDNLIDKTQQKIDILKELRTSLINQVVTKGLDPNVEMKDSGVEWIGEIPKHWIISKLKYDTSVPVMYGINISGDKYVDDGIRFVRITDITEDGGLIESDGKYLVEEDVPTDFLLNKYDVLFCRSGHTVGKSYLHLSEGKYTSGGYLVRFNFRNYTESKFVFYLSKTHFYWDWIRLNTVVSTIENVNGDKYQNFVYSKPPLLEQENIVKYLDEQTQLIDTSIQKEEQRIEKLKEYRQSLISDIVTGKIKVTDNE